jgi:predicted methyltransferase
MLRIIITVAALAVVACQPADGPGDVAEQEIPEQEPVDGAATVFASNGSERLASVLAAQSEEFRARYRYRHPQETLEFFEVEPGMTVVEALPGGGWYTKVLLPYLGLDGHLIGADYAEDMWPLFGFYSEEQLEAKKTWIADFIAGAEEWRGDDSAGVSAFVLGSLPGEMHGTADRFLFIRALHNLSRFEGQGEYLTKAIGNAYDILKPGGIVGVVQHQAPDEMSDEWAGGSRGYLKKKRVIALLEGGGFEYLGEIGINHNHNDKPGEEDIVWRLSPSFATSRDNPQLKAELAAIGESNRMTLKFRKP